MKFQKPILLEELTGKYAFVAPQAFAYDKTYQELTSYISGSDKQLVVIN